MDEGVSRPRPDAGQIAEIILERICLLRYPPGARLKEADLAREFGVSRTPLRDALSRIAHLGLIVSRNGVGTVVAELPPAAVREIYALRLELAVLIGRLSPVSPGERELAALMALRDAAAAAARSADAAQYVRLNHRLNLLVAGMIGNAALRDTWLQLYRQAASTWHRVAETLGSEVWGALTDELDDLITAARAGDAQAVGHVQRVHIGYGLAKIERMWRSRTGAGSGDLGG